MLMARHEDELNAQRNRRVLRAERKLDGDFNLLTENRIILFLKKSLN